MLKPAHSDALGDAFAVPWVDSLAGAWDTTAGVRKRHFCFMARLFFQEITIAMMQRDTTIKFPKSRHAVMAPSDAGWDS